MCVTACLGFKRLGILKGLSFGVVWNYTQAQCWHLGLNVVEFGARALWARHPFAKLLQISAPKPIYDVPRPFQAVPT